MLLLSQDHPTTGGAVVFRSRPSLKQVARERTYFGEYGARGSRVWVAEHGRRRQLERFCRPQPATIPWGHSHESAEALAWALLFDATGDKALAEDWSWDFCLEVVSQFPLDRFSISRTAVSLWLDR